MIALAGNTRSAQCCCHCRLKQAQCSITNVHTPCITSSTFPVSSMLSCSLLGGAGMQCIHLFQAECQAGNPYCVALVKLLEQLLWLVVQIFYSCFCSGCASLIALWVQQARSLVRISVWAFLCWFCIFCTCLHWLAH